uniref:RNA-directed RNA polymerase n=1 Tax=Beihai levi-like virus 13 TaxID=1922398 RepID=A0A1L3KI17_9VIRU|nr:hypothetical protein [Beihai levi-like virus 13]
MSKKGKRSFSPDSILTEVHQALISDLNPLKLEYKMRFTPGLEKAIRLQVQDFKKKFLSPEQDTHSLESEAFKKFETINSHILKVNETLGKVSLPKDRRNASDFELTLIRARALIHGVLGYLDEDSWFYHCSNSNGSSLGVPFFDTSPEKKMSYPLSATEKSVLYFERYLSWDHRFHEALLNLNSEALDNRYRFVEGSRATTVPKSSTARRMICIEPTVNMFLQQGLMRLMMERMKTYNLDVSVLPFYHKQLARFSSLSGNLSTIDWSSASDCNSIELCRLLLSKRWFSILMAIRCDKMEINGSYHDLNMISTMGNAATFPLETLIFWALAQAVHMQSYCQNRNTLFPEWEKLKSVSVFGDDCIVPTEIAETFISFCESVGFIANREKSYFASGPGFRESCGGDYYRGYDVRPYHVRSPLNCKISCLEPWLYIMFNSLLKRYISYFGELEYIYDKALFKLFFAVFRRYNLTCKIVPSYFPDDSGLKIAFDRDRFVLNYPGNFSKLARDRHGTFRFNYYRFVYWTREHRDDYLRYSIWLKKPVQSDIVIHDFPIRKRGGYVVARGISSRFC